MLFGVYYTIDILNEISHIGYFDKEFYVYNVQNLTSVIRSEYSLKKLKSIGAGAYVVEHTSHYTEEIKNLAQQYLTDFLLYHYNSLYLNPALDNDFVIRKKIRSTIEHNYNQNNFNIYPYIVIKLRR